MHRPLDRYGLITERKRGVSAYNMRPVNFSLTIPVSPAEFHFNLTKTTPCINSLQKAFEYGKKTLYCTKSKKGKKRLIEQNRRRIANSIKDENHFIDFNFLTLESVEATFLCRDTVFT